ncbi:hypothetical protein [Amycolatopsis sp. DG1A-15b]|uniref:hypothetical protein n=1 Tax=Amycolatopsis sp. DG1A-15b TaxID=3052846 RepID=UPI00255B7CB9|nr:hypothetical protein [Amycolatopsis sp. DG1A-15b]WIX92048.1 hypothetical protein QRY02_17020 [Amycolatopsis sp. DG1A-15b]
MRGKVVLVTGAGQGLGAAVARPRQRRAPGYVDTPMTAHGGVKSISEAART